MADTANTANRTAFASAGAPALLKGRRRPATPLDRAYVKLLRALASLPPRPVANSAGAADVQARARYMREVHHIVARYLDGVMLDTISRLPAADREVDQAAIEQILWEGLNGDFDVVAALRRAGCRFGLADAA
ncbi:MAG TPA: hypothetical protein VKT99_16770 [Xanthobacteraceae bacterium]|jgi:hypothetical protein|nr:hypothetical protein [Xanthobacteraceae bacterium]